MNHKQLTNIIGEGMCRLSLLIEDSILTDPFFEEKNRAKSLTLHCVLLYIKIA